MSERKRKPVPGSEPFEALGEVWHLAPIGPGIRSAFAQSVRLRAKAELRADRAHMELADYQEDHAALEERIAAGAYSWGPPPDQGGAGMGSAIWATYSTDEGKMRLTQMLLEAAHGELSLHAVKALVEDNVSEWASAFRKAQGLPALPPEPQEDADPNSPAASLSAQARPQSQPGSASTL